MESLILLAILPALYWLMRETNWLRVDLMAKPAIRLLPAGKPVLLLAAGDPANYPIAFKGTVSHLRAILKELSNQELELTED